MIVGSATSHVDKGIIDGLWRGDMKCIAPKAKDADLWILIWEEVRRVHQEGMLLEVSYTPKRIAPRRRSNKLSLVENVSLKAMRKQTNWQQMEIGASTVQQHREKFYVVLQYAASFRCLVEELHDCEGPAPKLKDKWMCLDSTLGRVRNIVRSGVRPQADTVV